MGEINFPLVVLAWVVLLIGAGLIYKVVRH